MENKLKDYKFEILKRNGQVVGYALEGKKYYIDNGDQSDNRSIEERLLDDYPNFVEISNAVAKKEMPSSVKDVSDENIYRILNEKGDLVAIKYLKKEYYLDPTIPLTEAKEKLILEITNENKEFKSVLQEASKNKTIKEEVKAQKDVDKNILSEKIKNIKNNLKNALSKKIVLIGLGAATITVAFTGITGAVLGGKTSNNNNTSSIENDIDSSKDSLLYNSSSNLAINNESSKNSLEDTSSYEDKNNDILKEESSFIEESSVSNEDESLIIPPSYEQESSQEQSSKEEQNNSSIYDETSSKPYETENSSLNKEESYQSITIDEVTMMALNDGKFAEQTAYSYAQANNGSGPQVDSFTQQIYEYCLNFEQKYGPDYVEIYRESLRESIKESIKNGINQYWDEVNKSSNQESSSIYEDSNEVFSETKANYYAELGSKEASGPDIYFTVYNATIAGGDVSIENFYAIIDSLQKKFMLENPDAILYQDAYYNGLKNGLNQTYNEARNAALSVRGENTSVSTNTNEINESATDIYNHQHGIVYNSSNR